MIYCLFETLLLALSVFFFLASSLVMTVYMFIGELVVIDDLVALRLNSFFICNFGYSPLMLITH